MDATEIIWNQYLLKYMRFHDMTLSACNRNIMAKIIQTFIKYCAVAVLQCQWNFGDDVETQFKFNSKSVTLVISTREYYELFQF